MDKLLFQIGDGLIVNVLGDVSNREQEVFLLKCNSLSLHEDFVH